MGVAIFTTANIILMSFTERARNLVWISYVVKALLLLNDQ